MTVQKVSLVVAMTGNRVIANGDVIPWDVRDDRELFRSLIKGKTVVMGRSTFDLMGRKAIGAHTVVLSRSAFAVDGVDVCSDIMDAMRIAQGYGQEIFVIGGASVFALAIDLVDEMHISYIKGDYAGDKFFPQFDPADWEVVRKKEFKDFEYVVYSRKRKKAL